MVPVKVYNSDSSNGLEGKLRSLILAISAGEFTARLASILLFYAIEFRCRIIDDIVRAAIRSGEYETAVEWIDQMDDEILIGKLQTILSLHQSDRDAYFFNYNWLPVDEKSFFHYDVDAKPFIQTDLAELARENPARFHSHEWGEGETLELLLDNNVELDLTALKAGLRDIFGVDTEGLQFSEMSNPIAITAISDQFRISVATQPAHYQPLSSVEHNQKLREAFARHAFILTVKVIATDAQMQDRVIPCTTALAIKLSQDTWIAIGRN